MERTLSLLGFSFFAVVVACTSSTTGTNGSSSSSSSSSSGSSATVSTQECNSRCQTKATSCQAPADAASQECGQLCGGSLTEAQLSCLEGKTCEELAKADSFDSLCPAGSSSSSSGSSTSSSSSSGSSGCSSTPTCNAEGDGVSTCTMKDGIPVTETVKCSNGKCKDGQCGYCTSKSDCSGTASCTCKDGTGIGVFVSYDCISNQCELTSNPDCGTACADHGGAQ